TVDIDTYLGVDTGISAGTAIISYTAGGCSATMTVTVGLPPGAILGTPAVCVGGTTFFFEGTPGGTWSSSNPAVATIGSATGMVTGITPGTSVISYTLLSGCSATLTVTVNPLPAPISGTLTVCVGQTTLLTDASGGGTWSSASPGIATISAGGLVTGISAGTSVITYMLGTGCF